MDVLLINPPYALMRNNPHYKLRINLPPLGLLSIAAYVREHLPYVRVHVLDAPAHGFDGEQFRQSLQAYQPDVVGVSVYTATFNSAMRSVEVIRKLFPRTCIVVGGPHASSMPEECLRSSCVDIAVIGEGEGIFTSLLECLSQKKDIASVPNIVYRNGGKIVRSVRLDYALDLDVLPLPARDMIDMRIYHAAHGGFTRTPTASMVTSRGCPFACSFCLKSVFGVSHRFQSPERTMEEVRLLVGTYGVREITFQDDVFTFNKERVLNFCALLRKAALDLTWSCITRVDLVDAVLLREMKMSGCVSIAYGIESADPVFLKKMDKKFSIEKAKEVIRLTRRLGIETRASYIIGYPGETKQTIQGTIRAAIDVDSDFAIFALAMPIPGTLLHKEAKEKGLLVYDGHEMYDRCDSSFPLIRIEGMTQKEVLHLYRYAYRRYYFRWRYLLRHCSRIRSLEGLMRYMRGFISFYSWRGLYADKIIPADDGRLNGSERSVP